MIIKSLHKKLSTNIDIKIRSQEGTYISIERKNCIKYLGVLIDDSLSCKFHISYICSCLSRNAGIFLKLRHYVSLAQLKLLYYSLVYPYITYAIVAWGSTYNTQLKNSSKTKPHRENILFC